MTGSVVAFNATGVAPAQPVLRIAGRAADLVYAGPIPLTVSLIQINARVPEGIPPGDAVEAQITSAGIDSLPIRLSVR